jgi:activator of HSP90 ATPase
MPIVIKQQVRFKGISAAELFDIYTDPERHGAAVGAPATISPSVGSDFSVFGPEGLKGRMLYLDHGRIVVQSWRSNAFTRSDPDSIVTLVFTPTEAGSRIDLCHANVPARLTKNTSDGWREMYWRPWRDYVRRQRGRPHHNPTSD